jgi:hypothetical protein
MDIKMKRRYNIRTVYALLCPISHMIFYIGQTYIDGLELRLKQHISHAKRYSNHNPNLEKYIRYILENNLYPIMIPLEDIETSNIKEASKYECKWYEYYTKKKCMLLNLDTAFYGTRINQVVPMHKTEYKDTILKPEIENEIKNAIKIIMSLPNGIKMNGKVNRTLVQRYLKYNMRQYKRIQQYCDINGY